DDEVLDLFLLRVAEFGGLPHEQGVEDAGLVRCGADLDEVDLPGLAAGSAFDGVDAAHGLPPDEWVDEGPVPALWRHARRRGWRRARVDVGSGPGGVARGDGVEPHDRSEQR